MTSEIHSDNIKHFIYRDDKQCLSVKKNDMFDGLINLQYRSEDHFNSTIIITKDDAKRLIKILENMI